MIDMKENDETKNEIQNKSLQLGSGWIKLCFHDLLRRKHKVGQEYETYLLLWNLSSDEIILLLFI